MTSKLYKIKFSPLSGKVHFALFLQTHAPYGRIIDVQGDLKTGMKYLVTEDVYLKEEKDFVAACYVGKVLIANYSRVMGLSKFVLPPWKQLDEQGQKLDPDDPLYGDEQWCDDVLRVWKEDGILWDAVQPESWI